MWIAQFLTCLPSLQYNGTRRHFICGVPLNPSQKPNSNILFPGITTWLLMMRPRCERFHETTTCLVCHHTEWSVNLVMDELLATKLAGKDTNNVWIPVTAMARCTLPSAKGCETETREQGLEDFLKTSWEAQFLKWITGERADISTAMSSKTKTI